MELCELAAKQTTLSALHGSQRSRTHFEVVAPYNVIAFVVGHNHGTGPMPNWINATYNGSSAAFWKNAALIRVTPSVTDVGYVNSNNLSSPWISGSSFAFPFPNQVWVKIPTNNGNYFGPLKSIYVDTHAITVGNSGGTNSRPLRSQATQAGHTSIPLAACLQSMWTWRRLPPGLCGIFATNPSSGERRTVINGLLPGDYFPTSGGSTDLYANTNLVNSPKDPIVPVGLKMGGVAFYQQEHRIALRVLSI
ncbi:hypothetical protein FB451DRAFT_1196359 [Mycena latifolia]|nr:hypothetical protein FB451DRAFT_1196359 [Mycena latifolia]